MLDYVLLIKLNAIIVNILLSLSSLPPSLHLLQKNVLVGGAGIGILFVPFQACFIL